MVQTNGSRPILATGGVVLKGSEVLLIQRGRVPFKGQWSIPGGKVEHGERLEDAVRREVMEETGIACQVLGLIGVFEAMPRREGEPHFVMADYACRWVSGEPLAADDAMDAAFMPLAEALAHVAWDETRRAVQGALRFAREVG
jgi:8-oxo-dGTP diphosphatase